MALVSDEISELQGLEAQFTSAGTELEKYKQALSEIVARNFPVIKELSQKRDDLKIAINEIDVEMFMQNAVTNNKNLEVVRQQNLCNSLSASKDEGDLEFARHMVSQETLIQLQQELKAEKAKLQELNDRFNELKVVPDLVNLVREIRELETEAWTVQQQIYSIERDRREMNSRTMFLRSMIAKNEAGVSVLA
jgi:chromosome segregation ATPase